MGCLLWVQSVSSWLAMLRWYWTVSKVSASNRCVKHILTFFFVAGNNYFSFYCNFFPLNSQLKTLDEPPVAIPKKTSSKSGAGKASREPSSESLKDSASKLRPPAGGHKREPSDGDAPKSSLGNCAHVCTGAGSVGALVRNPGCFATKIFFQCLVVVASLWVLDGALLCMVLSVRRMARKENDYTA